MNYRLSLFSMMLFSLLQVSSDAWAASFEIKSWRPVVSIGGGIATTDNLGQSQTFPIQNQLTDEAYIYSPTPGALTAALGEVFLGAEHSIFSSKGLIDLGVSYAQTGTYRVNGAFSQGVSSASANQFNYQFNAISRQLLAQMKLSYAQSELVYPYFLLGLGGASNSASNFTTNIPIFLTFTRDYANHTSHPFSYSLGLGFDLHVMSHVRLGFGYRYTDLGTVQLGATNIDGTKVSGTLSQSNFYANEVMAHLTYVM